MKKQICNNNKKYMVKNRTKFANKTYKEYLVWLKESLIKTAKIQKEYECAVKTLADEITRRHKEYLAKCAEEEKKIGKRQFLLRKNKK